MSKKAAKLDELGKKHKVRRAAPRTLRALRSLSGSGSLRSRAPRLTRLVLPRVRAVPGAEAGGDRAAGAPARRAAPARPPPPAHAPLRERCRAASDPPWRRSTIWRARTWRAAA